MSGSDLAQRTRAQQGKSAKSAERSQELARVITSQRAGLSQALADRIGVERFIRAAATVIRTTPKLADCSDDSILGGLYIAAQLGLEVGGPRGLAYLVPYGKEAALVVGYRGWVDLLYRAGARSVSWFIVREGDTWQKGSDSERGPWYRWVPLDDDEGRQAVRYVAQVQTATGGQVWLDMTPEQIARRSTGSSIWRQWPEEMSLKTVLRALVKLLQTSTEHLALAQQVDETVQHRREVPGLEPELRAERLPVAADRQPAPPRQAARAEEPAAPADDEIPADDLDEQARWERDEIARHEAEG